MEHNSQPLVSVVTPFYNEEKYLAQCVESVLAQSYQNFEFILVDNCSKDCSYKIAQEFANKDRRIHLYSNEQLLTQAQNHNRALSLISDESKYCKMVLGDDWIFRECLAQMVELAEKHPNVGVVSSYRLSGTKVQNAGLPPDCRTMSGREACRLHLINGVYLFGTQTSVMCRSSIVRTRRPFFNGSTYSFDAEVCYEILERSDFGFIHQVLTFTRTDNESVSTSTHDFNSPGLSKFIIVNKYGRIYLSDEEYKDCLRKITRNYFGFLAASVFELKSKYFWQYHKKELEGIGKRVYSIQLAKYVLWELIDIILNPKKTIGRMMRLFLTNPNTNGIK